MSSVYQLKPAFQNLLRPLTRRLAALGVTANQVTSASLLGCFAYGAWMAAVLSVATLPLLCMPVILLARMALNAIDGMLAREHGMHSALGTLLNDLADVLSDVALFLPLAFLPGVHRGWLIAVVILAIVSEMAGVLALQIGAQRRHDGPMGKSDRALVFALLCWLIGAGVVSPWWFDVAMMVLFGLLCLTIVNRLRHALREVA